MTFPSNHLHLLMYLRGLSLLLLLFLLGGDTTAQVLGGIYSRYDNDLSEWIVVDDEGREIGHLRMRFPLHNDITLWGYRVGDQTGEIRARWRDNFREWEVHGDGEIITMRQVWRDVPTEWRLTDDKDITLSWITRWANTPGDWEMREKDLYGRFEQFMAWENDPRDWVIIDDLDPDIPLPMRMGMVFLPILLLFL
jgi:hypothetical protein